jgi:peptide/nickel transport system permease protein
MGASNPQHGGESLASAAPAAGDAAAEFSEVRKRPSTWIRLARNSKFRFGLILLLLVVGSAIAAPVLSPHSPRSQNIRNTLAPPVWNSEGTWEHPLGTDQLGRDILARVLHGGRISLLVALFATVAASAFGIALGLAAGYAGRTTDAVIMRLVDVQLAFPAILLALAVIVMLGPSFRNLIIVLAIGSWVFFGRIIRADVLTIKNREFITAGRAIGATHGRLVMYYIMPNLVGVITVVATLTIARVVISEASLSFLGLGIQPPTPTWGLMLAEGRGYLSVAWWITTIPGIALMATVIAVNLLGDALRDVLDPQLSGSDN